MFYSTRSLFLCLDYTVTFKIMELATISSENLFKDRNKSECWNIKRKVLFSQVCKFIFRNEKKAESQWLSKY